MSDVGPLVILNELTSSEKGTGQTDVGSRNTLNENPAECPVCMEQMVDPTILPTCGHTFCRKCLKEMCKSQERKTIRCPIDRQPCVLPRNDVDSLPMNFALRDVLQRGCPAADDAESLHSLKECSECHSTASLHVCGHCDEYLCIECIDLHREENATRLRRVSQQLRAIRVRCEECLAQRRLVLEEQQEVFDCVRDEVGDFANAFLSKLNGMVERHKQRLLDKISQHQSWLEDNLGKEIHELEADELYVTVCKARIDKILKNRSISVSENQINILAKGTSKILHKNQYEVTPKLVECHFRMPSTERQDGVYQQVERLLEEESLAGELVVDQMEENEQPPECSRQPDIRPTVFPPPSQVQSQQSDSPVVGVQWRVLGTGKGSAAGEFDRPSGVAVSQASRTICVADFNNHRLQWFNYDAAPLCTVGKYGAAVGQFDCPIGVACRSTPRGNFVVSDFYNHRLQVMDSVGEAVCVVGKYGSGAGCFSRPQGVAVDSITGRIYVCDSGNHRVQIFKANTTFSGTFGSIGKSNGQFICPVDIAVAQGRVVVADCNNNRLQVFTTAGKHTRTITGEHVESPWGVALNQGGDKLHACCNTGILVYQLSPVVELVQHIPSPVVGHRPEWIALLSDSEALVTLDNVHVVHRIHVS